MDPSRLDNQKLRPRDFQFSLGRMLVAMTVVAVLVSLAMSFGLPQLMGWVGLCWILGLVVFVVLYSDWSHPHTTNGRRALDAGDFRRALVAFDHAIKADPEDPERYYLRAVAHSSLVNLEEAIDDYSKAIELNRRFAPAWIGRADMRRRRQEFQEAIDDTSIGLCLLPSDPNWVAFRAMGLVVRGSCYRALGRTDESFEEFDEAVRIAPGRAESYMFRGSARLELKQYHQALSDFDEAIKRGASDRGTLHERAVTLFQLGSYDAAMAQIETCLDAYPQALDAMCVHARFLATCPDDALRDGERALELATTALGLGAESDWHCEASLAAACAELGRFEEAIEHARKSLELAPASNRHDLEEALAEYKEGRPYRHRCSSSPE